MSSSASTDKQTSAAMDALLAALSEMGGEGEVGVSTVTVGADGSVKEAPLAEGASVGNGQQQTESVPAPAPKGLESLMMLLGQQLAQNRAGGNGDEWAGKPKGGASVLAPPTVAGGSGRSGSAGDAASLDDLVLKAQQQLRDGGEAARQAMAASQKQQQQQPQQAAASPSASPSAPPPRTKAEYDAMSLNDLVEELSKVQSAGVKLV